MFAISKTESWPMVVGSVKSNIGHLESAAGISGLIKVILVLAHECVPPNIGLKTMNPLIDTTIRKASTSASKQQWCDGCNWLQRQRRQGCHVFLSEQGGTKEMVDNDRDGDSCRVIVEVGPKPVLCKFAQHWWKSSEAQSDPVWIVSLEPGEPSNVKGKLEAINKALSPKSGLISPQLSNFFPNRMRLPWPESPPHPLLQHDVPIGYQGTEYHTIFHDKLMELYSNHMIQGQVLFPGAGYIEMGLAAGARRCERGSNTGVELLDVKFIHPLELKVSCKLVCSHHFTGSGRMEFHIETPKHDDNMMASIGKFNTDIRITAPKFESLEDLRCWHTQRVPDIQGRYASLGEAGYHRHPFQSIKSVFLNKKGDSALGFISLPDDFMHDHDTYYLAHPAVLDGSLQMVSFVTKSLKESEAWVPAGITRMTMYHAGVLHQREGVWSLVTLVDEGSKIKSCNISLFDKDGHSILFFEGLRYARLSFAYPEASLYTAKWTPSLHKRSFDMDDIMCNVVVIQLSDCLPYSKALEEKPRTLIMTLSKLKSLDAQKVPTNIVVPLLSLLKKTTISSFLEECLILIQTLASTLSGKTDDTTHQVCFWTCNAEGPWVDDRNLGLSVANNEYSSLIGSSVWGMARSASLEIDPSVLRMICVDTNICSKMEGFTQVLQELHWVDDHTKLLDSEVSYRGEGRFVRRLRRSNHHVIGDAELTLNNRGSLENIDVLPLRSHPVSIPNKSVEVSVHAVGLNFKDVLNVLIPNEAEYAGFDTLPLPGSDFAGIVTAIT